MRAVILAAGFGKRMMPLTAETHKCLLKIAGKPVLTRIIDALTANDIYDATIVTGWHADELKEFMRTEHPNVNVQWIHNENYETTNNIYSLSLALEQISGEDIILIECDLVFDPSIITIAKESPYDATALVSLYEPGMDGTVVSLSSDIITAIHPPHLQGDDFVIFNKYKTLNIYKFSKRFVDESLSKLTSFYARSINNNCYYELVLGVMIYMQSSEIRAAVVDTSMWAEIDDPVDVQTTEFKFNPPQRLHTLDSTYGAYWNYPIQDFCYVQNPYFPTEGMVSMLRHHLPLLLKSFGSSQANLDRKLSFFLECEDWKLVTLNGSSQIFPWLRDQLVNKTVLIPDPTFGEYPRMFPNAGRYCDKVGIDEKSLSAKVAEHDVIVFVNPNNPTGTILRTEFLRELTEKHPEKLFVFDESFIDFSDERSIIEYLEKNPRCTNAIVVKSLGKSLGVPGLRLGFAYSNDDAMMKRLRDSLPIWNTNSMAEYFLELLLKNRRSLGESYSLVKRARLAMQEKLAGVPYIDEIFPSQANFLLARINPHRVPSQGLALGLLERHNIYVKDITSKFADGNQYYRFAVRKSEANEMLIRALHDVAVAPSAVKQ